MPRGHSTVAATLVALFVGLGLTLAPRSADAQPTNNDYAIDLFQGPLLAPNRVASMGGAYAGYAQGIDGFVSNAASPAVRHPNSLTWWDQDIDASISFPLRLTDNNDFDNSGDLDADYSNFIYLSGGLQLQAGPFGTGFFGDLQRYELSFANEEDATVVTVGRYHLLVGWGFLNHQLNVGLGLRAMTLSIEAPTADLTFAGFSPQVGILVRPDWMPFRIGATYRHQVAANFSIGSGQSTDELGVVRAGALVIPSNVELPWELEIGAAVQVGARPLNPSWINPHDHEDELRAAYREREELRQQREARALNAVPPGPTREALRTQLEEEGALARRRERRRLEEDLHRLRDERRARTKNWPREALLLNVDLLVTGPVDNAISLERFLSQGQVTVDSQCRVVASGEEVNFSPRFGIEVEPIRNYVHTRFGSYYEPPRYRHAPEGCNDRVGRQHFTFGADLKLLSTTWWGLVPEVTYKLQGYGDLAPRYQSFGGGIGVWY